MLKNLTCDSTTVSTYNIILILTQHALTSILQNVSDKLFSGGEMHRTR